MQHRGGRERNIWLTCVICRGSVLPTFYCRCRAGVVFGCRSINLRFVESSSFCVSWSFSFGVRQSTANNSIIVLYIVPAHCRMSNTIRKAVATACLNSNLTTSSNAFVLFLFQVVNVRMNTAFTLVRAKRAATQHGLQEHNSFSAG